MTSMKCAYLWVCSLKPVSNPSRLIGVPPSSVPSRPRRLRAPHSQIPINYGPGVDPIWVMTDACGNWRCDFPRKGLVYREFYSAKMSPAHLVRRTSSQTYCRVCMSLMPRVPCERPQNSSNMMGREWTLTRYSRCLVCCCSLCPRPGWIGGIGHDSASSKCPPC